MDTVTVTVKDCWCPRCDSPEVNPDTQLLWIKGYKVQTDARHGWQSHCLRCHCWFAEDGQTVTTRCGRTCACWKSYPAEMAWFVYDELGDAVASWGIDQRKDAFAFAERANNVHHRDFTIRASEKEEAGT